jgi:DNA-binding transcriptional LysR family regulator
MKGDVRLNLNHLAMLRELDRLGTLTAVAGSLNYTSGALSQQMDALERAVGAPVLTRSGRRVVLTDVGRALVDHAEAVLDAEERAREAATAAQGRPAAPVTLGTWGSTAAALLLPVLRAAAAARPGLQVRTREVDVNTAAAAVRRREVDAAFGLDYPDWPIPRGKDIELVRLRRERFVVAAAASAGLPRRVRLPDLADRPWILPVRETAMGRAMFVAFRRAGVEPDVPHEVNDTASSLRLVEQGLGLAPVTDLMLRLAPGARLRCSELDETVIRDLVLIVPVDRRGRAGVDALVETVRTATATADT